MEIIPFDKRIGFIWYNGEFVEWQNATTHVLIHACTQACMDARMKECMDAFIQASMHVFMWMHA